MIRCPFFHLAFKNKTELTKVFPWQLGHASVRSAFVAFRLLITQDLALSGKYSPFYNFYEIGLYT
jgi:hypothetical protein